MAYIYNKHLIFSTVSCIYQSIDKESLVDRYKFGTGTRYSFTEGTDNDLTVIARIKERGSAIFYKTQEQLDREMSQQGVSNE